MQNSGMCWIFLQISGNIKSGSIHTLTSALGAGWLALGATLLCFVLRALMIVLGTGLGALGASTQTARLLFFCCFGVNLYGI
jgi:hypothetical protein